MELIETIVFTKQVQATFSDEEYRALQLQLVLRPDIGDIIPGSGGAAQSPMADAWPRQARWRTSDLLLEDCGGADLSPLSISEERAERSVVDRTANTAETRNGRLTWRR